MTSKNKLRRFASHEALLVGAEEAFREGQVEVTAANDDARQAFYTRGVRAVALLATKLSKTALASSLAEENGVEGLLTALGAADDVELAPGGRAFVRGLLAKRALLEAEGGTLTAPELEKVFELTRQHVNVLRESGKLLAVQLGSRVYQYPVWQFDEKTSRPLEGLERVLAVLREQNLDEWSAFIFFLEPNPGLETAGSEVVTPLEALRKGRLEAVLRAADAWGT